MRLQIISALKIEMISAFPFFKREEKTLVNQPVDTGINNTAARTSVGNPRFGFQTLLAQKQVPLPTAPAIVGGNVDWTKSRVTPATQYLHSVLAGSRPMQPPAALGSMLRLGEPTINSIHTQY
jgi:hypothetical protein